MSKTIIIDIPDWAEHLAWTGSDQDGKFKFGTQAIEDCTSVNFHQTADGLTLIEFAKLLNNDCSNLECLNPESHKWEKSFLSDAKNLLGCMAQRPDTMKIFRLAEEPTGGHLAIVHFSRLGLDSLCKCSMPKKWSNDLAIVTCPICKTILEQHPLYRFKVGDYIFYREKNGVEYPARVISCPDNHSTKVQDHQGTEIVLDPDEAQVRAAKVVPWRILGAPDWFEDQDGKIWEMGIHHPSDNRKNVWGFYCLQTSSWKSFEGLIHSKVMQKNGFPCGELLPVED